MSAARLLDCTTARTTNGRVIKGELLSRVFVIGQLGCGNWRASACRTFESHNERDCYAVVVVNNGVVVTLLSKPVSRILAELHKLSKGISYF